VSEARRRVMSSGMEARPDMGALLSIRREGKGNISTQAKGGLEWGTQR
jgi:hypothetical protein